MYNGLIYNLLFLILVFGCIFYVANVNFKNGKIAMCNQLGNKYIKESMRQMDDHECISSTKFNECYNNSHVTNSKYSLKSYLEDKNASIL